MPANQFSKPLVRGIERNKDWALIFFNNRQKLFIDMTTSQGKKLFDGIFNGKTVYPDKFSRNLILAYYHLRSGKKGATLQRALSLAIDAFKEQPSQAPIQQIIFASRFPELRPVVKKFLRSI